MTKTESSLKGKKYNLFCCDLMQAYNNTRSLEETEDGGTCNFDAPCVRLPRWNADSIRKAAEMAGWHAWKWYGSTWILSFPTTGQGNRRSRRAEALEKELRNLGYDTGMYYAMD